MNLPDTPSLLIASGYVELYVLKRLTAEENAYIETMSQRRPEVDAEIKLTQEALATYAHIHSRVIKADTPPHLQPYGNSTGKINAYKILIAASWTCLLGVVVYCYVLYTQLGRVETKLTSIENEKNALALERTQWSGQKEALLSIGLQKIPLRSTRKDEIVAHTWYNPTTGELYIHNLSLSAPPSGSQYQVWNIVSEIPTSTGLLPRDYTLQHWVVQNGKAQAKAIAISIEKEGGAPSPTQDNIVAVAEI